jgi:hypothetical protein
MEEEGGQEGVGGSGKESFLYSGQQVSIVFGRRRATCKGVGRCTHLKHTAHYVCVHSAAICKETVNNGANVGKPAWANNIQIFRKKCEN